MSISAVILVPISPVPGLIPVTDGVVSFVAGVSLSLVTINVIHQLLMAFTTTTGAATNMPDGYENCPNSNVVECGDFQAAPVADLENLPQHSLVPDAHFL